MNWLLALALMLAFTCPAFGQMATTTATSTPPYDVSTVEGYREWAIRFAAALCRLGAPRSFPNEPAGGWPAVDDISHAWFEWQALENGRGSHFLRFPCASSPLSDPVVCSTQRPYDMTLYKDNGERLYDRPLPPASCAQLRLPPIGATVPHWDIILPDGYSWYGEPPQQAYNPPPGAPTPDPEPEPEAPAEPVGNLEVPGNGSFQSGIGYVSGWVCDAETVAIVIDGGLHLPPVARHISRGDTEAVCGDQNNGFISLWNWNLMGNGTYTAALVVDGRTVQENRFTVTTLGEEFVTGATGECSITDFPSPDEDVLLRWQEGVQGFVIVPSPSE